MILHGIYENGKIEILDTNIIDTLEKNKKIEVEIFIKDIETNNLSNKSAKGYLKKYNNPKLIKKEKKAWELAVKDKCENNRR